MKILALALLALTAPTAAGAQTCASYVGQTVTLNSFAAAAATAKRMPSAKGEYETTAQFEARVAAARGSMPETVVLPGIFSPKYVTYDADAGSLKVQAYALRNVATDYATVFGYGTPFYEKVKYSSLGNLDAVLLERETPTGTYVASNAYGAKATVTKVTRLHEALFEGDADYRTNLFVDQKEGVGAELGSIPMTVPDAQALKAGGKVAFVAKPKWPFYSEGTRTFDATITNPVEVTNNIHVVVADIQCGLLLTPTNKVVGAFATR